MLHLHHLTESLGQLAHCQPMSPGTQQQAQPRKRRKMYYTIDPESFAIYLYDGVNQEPFQFQPDYPNLDKFESYEEAENWAKAAIASHDPDCEYLPPDGKSIPARKKPTAQEISQAKIERLGFTVEELRTLLGIE